MGALVFMDYSHQNDRLIYYDLLLLWLVLMGV